MTDQTPEARERTPAWCVECGRMPARLMLQDGSRICGVCWHHCQAWLDLVKRLRRAS